MVRDLKEEFFNIQCSQSFCKNSLKVDAIAFHKRLFLFSNVTSFVKFVLLKKYFDGHFHFHPI